jgi:branched-chain amino acid transport system substrate-binding protein
VLLASTSAALAACTNNSSFFSSLNPESPPGPGGPPVAETRIGTGQVKVGVILPLSAAGNAGLAGQAMRNAAEMALAEFNAPNIQLLIKDDVGTPEGARIAAEQAIAEGAEIIVGPLFAQSVTVVGQIARTRNIPVIAFSTDTNVASRGVYLLSFLPESDVQRIVQYASANGKRSYAALIPDNPYGTVVEAAFKQDVARHNSRIIALERYPHDKAAMAGPVANVAKAAARADAMFIPDGGDAVPDVVQALVAGGMTKKIQYLGTGLWDDPRIFATQALDGGWYAAPDAAGFRNFSARYAARFKIQPVRTATLAYDAIALIAALVKTQNPQQRFSPEVLTNPSGFSGIDGLFRFRGDGTNERGLAVLRVTPTGPQTIAPPPKSFASSG